MTIISRDTLKKMFVGGEIDEHQMEHLYGREVAAAIKEAAQTEAYHLHYA